MGLKFEEMIDFFAERELSVSNTYFEQKSLESKPGWLEAKMKCM